MATIITKFSSTASAVPTASDLVQGELAVNTADKRLFTEDSGASIIEIGTNPSSLTTGNIVGSGTLAITGASTLTGNVTASNDLSIGGNLTVTGNATISGNLTFGDADTDSISLNADVDSHILPNTDDTYDLGSTSKQWRNLYIDGTANIDSLVADTADINGGTVDGAIIGASSAAAGTFTTATATTGNITTVNSTTVDSTNVEVTNLKAKDGSTSATIADATGVMTIASSVLTTTDINGGTIDGTTIGSTTASTGNFSTLSIGGTAITATAAELNTLDGITATTAELNYTDGVTSNIQTQLDSKAPIASPTFTGTVTIPAATVTGDVSFGDNDKAIFGAGSDLQIYHDGSNSYVEDTATGSLILKGADVVVKDSSNNDIAKFVNGGAAQLRYAGSTKLATTSTGIDVTGTATMDGLTVDGAFQLNGDITITDTSTDPFIKLETGEQSYVLRIDNDASDIFQIRDVTNASDRLSIANNGDISFYEDTGTTAKFFWDASAETLMLGSTAMSGTYSLIVGRGGSSSIGALFIGKEDSSIINNNEIGRIDLGGSADATLGASIYAEADANWTHSTSHPTRLLFSTTASSSATPTERMRIDSDGNVGIGTTSPNGKTEIASSATGDVLALQLSNSAGAGSDSVSLRFRNSTVSTSTSGGSEITGLRDASGNGGSLVLNTASSVGTMTERMRIDSSGNLLVATTNPDVSFSTSVGSSLQSNGQTHHSSSGTALVLNRTASDGTIAQFRKAGTTVGSIGTAGGYTHFISGTGGIRPINNTQLRPVNSDGSASDNTMDLGTSGIRFKDLYLSNAVYIDTGNLASNPRVYFDNDNFTGLSFIEVDRGTNAMEFWNQGSESMRIDTSGNVMVGTTDADNQNNSAGSSADNGFAVNSVGHFNAARYNGIVQYLNRTGTDGDIVQFRKGGTTVGSIGNDGTSAYFNSTADGGLARAGTVYFKWSSAQFYPNVDDSYDLGILTKRFDDIYATNGTIQTSDRNEKQDIEALSEAEQRVAVACKGLLRKFRWKSAVEEKGDDARIHFGIIAQDLQAAFEAEGLDAGRYAMFIHSTWTDEETGEERSRMGVRYSELLAFIIAAI